MKKTNLSLREYKGFFENSPVAFIRTDLVTGEFLMANRFAANVLGFDSVEDLIQNGNTKDLYWSIEDRDELLDNLLKKGNIVKYEVRLRTKTNQEIWVVANLHIDGTCIEGGLVDVTEYKIKEIKKYKKQLQKINDMSMKLDQALSDLT